MNPEINKAIIDFFSKDASPQDFSRILRKTNYMLIMLSSESDIEYKEEIAETYFWLTNFAETLDPYLHKK